MSTTTTTPFDTGRDLDWPILAAQIGRMTTVAAISGGRVVRLGPSTIDLPISSGYKVRITLAADDTYTVQRVMVRGDKTWVKGEQTNVYCDEVSEVAYQASSYKSYEFGDKVSS
jgi:hypothetical protein